MITIIIMILVAYATNKITRLYCVFKYKNDVEFIRSVMRNELTYNLKNNTFTIEQIAEEVNSYD